MLDTLLESIPQLTVSEKLAVMEALWESLSEKPEQVPVPDWHREELARREARIASGEAKMISWEEARARLERLGETDGPAER